MIWVVYPPLEVWLGWGPTRLPLSKMEQVSQPGPPGHLAHKATGMGEGGLLTEVGLTRMNLRTRRGDSRRKHFLLLHLMWMREMDPGTMRAIRWHLGMKQIQEKINMSSRKRLPWWFRLSPESIHAESQISSGVFYSVSKWVLLSLL